MITAYREPDRAKGRQLMDKLIRWVSAGVPSALTELITLGRTLKKRAAEVLAYFDRPGTSNGPTEAINGRREHLRGSALGFRTSPTTLPDRSSKPAASGHDYTLDCEEPFRSRPARSYVSRNSRALTYDVCSFEHINVDMRGQMKITGYTSLTTVHDWGRPIGDINGFVAAGKTEVPILLVHADGGLVGVGLGAHTDIERVFPAVEGEDPRSVTALYDRMLAYVFKTGHAGATFGTIGAVDMALWDLKAKMADEPLWRTLGGRDRFVPAYASGLDIALTDGELVALHERFADRGFASGKVKGGKDPLTDIARLKAVGDVLRRNSPRPALMLDANEAWNRKQAVRFVSEVEQQVELTWIEEPVRRWDAQGNAAVSRAVKAGVATGENLVGLEQYRPLLDANAVDIVQAGMVWGITHFLRVSALAHAFDLPVSLVGYNCNPVAHAATAVPNHLTTEVQDLDYPIGLTVDQEIADGGIVLGDAPGLGITVDEELIASIPTTDGWRITAGPHVRPERAGLRLVPEQ